MPILLPRFICIRSNISSQISDNTLRKIKFLGSYWKSHLCVSDSQSIIFRYQGWDKQKHWIQTERWNLGCQVINYASINQSINQSMHWEGRLAIELGSLGLCRNHPKEDFFICIDISNLRQLFDCYQPINLNSFNLGQSALHYLDSLSPPSTFLFPQILTTTTNMLVKDL